MDYWSQAADCMESSHESLELGHGPFETNTGIVETGATAGSLETPGTANTEVVETRLTTGTMNIPGTANTGTAETSKAVGSIETIGTTNTRFVETRLDLKSTTGKVTAYTSWHISGTCQNQTHNLWS